VAPYVILMEEQLAFWSFVDYISSKNRFLKISLRWLLYIKEGKFNKHPQKIIIINK
jgi:hypothetical protein